MLTFKQIHFPATQWSVILFFKNYSATNIYMLIETWHTINIWLRTTIDGKEDLRPTTKLIYQVFTLLIYTYWVKKSSPDDFCMSG